MLCLRAKLLLYLAFVVVAVCGGLEAVLLGTKLTSFSTRGERSIYVCDTWSEYFYSSHPSKGRIDYQREGLKQPSFRQSQ